MQSMIYDSMQSNSHQPLPKVIPDDGGNAKANIKDSDQEFGKLGAGLNPTSSGYTRAKGLSIPLWGSPSQYKRVAQEGRWLSPLKMH